MENLHTIGVTSLILAGVSSLVIIVDILSGHRQHMMIMNFVYPLTALYAGPLVLPVYFTLGRKSTAKTMRAAKSHNHSSHSGQKPFWQSVVIGALHCGSGCTLGDILAEILLLIIPFSLFGMNMYGAWVVDFIFAFAIGILFQYYSIKPMRDLSPWEALKAALKADTFSLLFWQIGMYGGMAIATFLIFHHELTANQPVFWFVMQIAMICGFITSYPVNWWLLKKNIKEVM